MRALRYSISYSIFLIAFISAFDSDSLADYHYASHTGSDEYPYTSWETAADSIQKAINAASAGDTIYVGSGVWEDVPCTLWNDLSLIGRGIDSTAFRKTSSIIYLTVHMRVVIRDITFDGLLPSYRCGGVQPVYHDTAVCIINNRFRRLAFGIDGVFTGKIVNNIFENSEEGINGFFDACSLLVRNNTFTGCTVPITGWGEWYVTKNIFHHNPRGGFIFSNFIGAWGYQDTAYVANNLFFHNLESETYDDEELIDVIGRAFLENNTLVGDPDFPRFIGVAIEPNIPNQRDLNNNIISGFQWAIRNYSQNIAGRLFYNDLWRNVMDAYVGNAGIDTIIGNLRVAPMFMDTLDFHLQAYSPLIDAGDPNILDVDGSRSDIGYTGGPGGFSYPYEDLPPRIPDSLAFSFVPDTVFLNWRYNYEADFNRYQVHRDTISSFVPDIFNLIAETDTSFHIDADITQSHDYYYRIAAVDNQDNLSEYSQELAVILTSVINPFDPNVPRLTEINQNYPNPFNSQTTISYYLADIGYQPAEVQLYIYNIAGQLVRRLVDSRQYPGRYIITWEGLGEGGEVLSSGVYFARLIVSGIELIKARKITFLR